MLKKVVIAVAAVAALIVGGTWVYINVIKEDAPEKVNDEPTGETTILTPSESEETFNDDLLVNMLIGFFLFKSILISIIVK